jgi:hypothetical protein
LAAQSLGVVKIQQDGFVDPPGGFLGPGQIVQPANLYGHDLSPFGKSGAALPKVAALLKFVHNIVIPRRKARQGPGYRDRQAGREAGGNREKGRKLHKLMVPDCIGLAPDLS